LATEKKPAIGRKLGFESTLFEGAFFMSGFESDQAFAQRLVKPLVRGLGALLRGTARRASLVGYHP